MVGRRSARQEMEVEEFLESLPVAVRDQANRLRSLVREAVPTAIERVYTGWQLIGYRVPVGRGSRYFGFIAPKADHVILGFEHGVFLARRYPWLQGSGSQVRQVQFVVGSHPPPKSQVKQAIRDAAQLAADRAHGGAAPLD